MLQMGCSDGPAEWQRWCLDRFMIGETIAASTVDVAEVMR